MYSGIGTTFGNIVIILFSSTMASVDDRDTVVLEAPDSHGVAHDTRFYPVWGSRTLGRESHLSTQPRVIRHAESAT